VECPSLFGESVNVNINVNVIYRVKDDTEQHADVGCHWCRNNNALSDSNHEY